MKKTFAEKSFNRTFLGMVAVFGATSILFTNCNQKKEKKESETMISKEPPVAKQVLKIDDDEVISDKSVFISLLMMVPIAVLKIFLKFFINVMFVQQHF